MNVLNTIFIKEMEKNPEKLLKSIIIDKLRAGELKTKDFKIKTIIEKSCIKIYVTHKNEINGVKIPNDKKYNYTFIDLACEEVIHKYITEKIITKVKKWELSK